MAFSSKAAQPSRTALLLKNSLGDPLIAVSIFWLCARDLVTSEYCEIGRKTASVTIVRRVFLTLFTR